MQRHERDAVAIFGLRRVHHQGDVLKEAGERVEVVHEADEFLEVFQPRLGLRALVLLPHRGVAAVIQDQLGKLGMAHRFGRLPPHVELGEQTGKRLACLGWQLISFDDLAGGLVDRDLAGTRERTDAVDRGIANGTLRGIDNPFELEVVGRVDGDLEVGDGVADFLAVIEFRAADDAIGQAERHEAVFKGAHLCR